MRCTPSDPSNACVAHVCRDWRMDTDAVRIGRAKRPRTETERDFIIFFYIYAGERPLEDEMQCAECFQTERKRQNVHTPFLYPLTAQQR